jgi:ComF family protein
MLGFLTDCRRELTQGLLQLLYPGTCQLCSRPLAPGQPHFCEACRAALTTDPFSTCPRCAATVGPYADLDGGCTHCRGLHFHFERVLRLGPYHDNPLLRQTILRLKHSSGEQLAEVLGELWAAHSEGVLRASGADAIVPIPLHWWRRWTRGYNQSAALARAIAARLGAPYRPAWIRRTRATPMQTSQPFTNRRANVRGAFRAGPPQQIAGKAILLVDDVLTTGNTCNEAAQALHAMGAARVVVAVLARGHS